MWKASRPVTERAAKSPLLRDRPDLANIRSETVAFATWSRCLIRFRSEIVPKSRAAARFPLCVLFALMVAGCSHLVWEKPGASTADFQADKGNCIGRAYSEVPPAMARATIGSGYVTPSYTNCYGYGYSASCTTTGGQYVPPAVVDYDANAGARKQVFQGCMYADGWSLVRIKN